MEEFLFLPSLRVRFEVSEDFDEHFQELKRQVPIVYGSRVYQWYEGLFTVNEEEIKDLLKDPLLLLINYGSTGGVDVWLVPRILSLHNERPFSCGIHQLAGKTFL